MKLTFAVGIIALLVGVLTGRTFIQSNGRLDGESESQREKGIQKLQDLADSDLADYYRLKTLEDRYKKADEILGKILTIFLSDLGVKLSPKTRATILTAAASDGFKSAESTAAATPQSQNVQNGTPSLKSQSVPPQTTNQIIGRASLDEVLNENDEKKFLKDSELKNTDDGIKSSTPFANKSGNLGVLQGHFVGQANVVVKNEPKIWEIDMDFRGTLNGTKLTGNHFVKMSENGKVFSDKSGNGDITDSYRELPSDPEATIIESSPTSFLQIYYIRQNDSIIGNVIGRDSATSPLKTIGTLKLIRSR